MQAVIGNSLVASLKPAEKPFEVRDTRLKGLLLRVQPSGVMSYYVEYARGRRVKIGRTGAITAAQARDHAKSILAESYKGRDPAAQRREAKAHTFRSFVDDVYAPWAAQNIRTATATVNRLKSTFPDLQSKKLNEITPWLVEKWRMARLKAGAKPTTVNRDLADLKSSLAKATAWGLLPSHPLSGVKRSKVDTNPMVRFLSAEEGERLHAALDAREEKLRDQRDSANSWRAERQYPLLADLRRTEFADHLKPLFLISLHTGLRRGELFGLVWHHIDLEHANLTVHAATAKAGRTRHVPLNATALSVLEGWRGQASNLDGLVFPGKDGAPLTNVRKSWMLTFG